MTEIVHDIPLPAQRPPAVSTGVIGWLRANLFNSVFNTILTLIAVYFLAITVPPMIRWAFIDAVWNAPNGQACRGAGGQEVGACWAFIGEKLRFILFGRFPYTEQWRPLLVVVLFIGLVLASCDPRMWGRRLLLLWPAGLADRHPDVGRRVRPCSMSDQWYWSGLPLPLILAVIGMLFAFPFAILLALGRRSQLPAVRMVSVAYIELVRGVPLITVLFMASVMLPLFLPSGFTIDKLLRAQVAFILFAAAYLAEVIRGGLQAIPKGQIEAADALGLGYWRRTRLIVLPQALAMVIPPLVNNFIGAFKNTSLVLIIGLFDLLNTANAALTDPNWQGFAPEAYIFTAAIYFCFCFFMSRYSQMLSDL
jgi:general L-amino acid transport system permease protein